ncbi:MAG: glycosyltransferase family 2 protein [Candidatus Krumholzibacteria bacterium]|jgi:glycosyltransferase involved in cell wall biosynthesis|nr:glycosyltransferase family 2 protein [Candidatus Krumholzibacteria bacterium]
MRISAVVHTLNEENNIEACLKCLRWTDEIIVVDMRSDDGTLEICKKYTDRIYSFDRTGGFVEPARGFGMGKAEGDWILIIDADERVPSALAARLREISERPDCDVVEIPFKNYVFGRWMRHTGMHPDYHPRFFRKGKVEPSELVHGKFKTAGKVLRLDAEDESNHIVHFGYRDCFQYVEKLNRYSTAELERFEASGREFSKTKMIKAGFYEFRRRYISKKGYKDGVEGLIVSVCRGFYHFLVYAKYWERLDAGNRRADEAYRAIEREIIDRHEEKQ